MKKLLYMVLTVLCASCNSDRTEFNGVIGRPDISPDGKKITFFYAEKPDDPWEIYVADISGGNAKQITFFPEALIKKGPVWSPDGSKIAFHADIDGGAQIFTIEPNGQNLTQITNAPGYNVEPYWSPDGNEIIYNLSLPSEGQVKMMIMNSDGTDVRALPNPDGQNWYPRITPLGQIVFTSNVHHGDFYDIFIMNPDSTEIRQLTSVQAINWFPEFSPDGSKIAFHSNRDDPRLDASGNYNLYIMNSDGTNVKQITDIDGQETHAKWHPFEEKLIFDTFYEGKSGLYMLNLQTNEIRKIELTH